MVHGAWCIKPTVDERAAKVQFEEATREALENVNFNGRQREPIPDHLFPLKMEQYAGRRAPPHFGYGSRNDRLMVNTPFKELVEELAPYAAHFAPVELCNSQTGKVTHGGFWIFLVALTIDAIDPDASSEVRRRYRHPETRRFHYEPFGELFDYHVRSSSKLVLRKEMLIDVHLWRNEFTPGTEGTYISDVLFEEMKSRGMEPFRRREITVI